MCGGWRRKQGEILRSSPTMHRTAWIISEVSCSHVWQKVRQGMSTPALSKPDSSSPSTPLDVQNIFYGECSAPPRGTDGKPQPRAPPLSSIFLVWKWCSASSLHLSHTVMLTKGMQDHEPLRAHHRTNTCAHRHAHIRTRGYVVPGPTCHPSNTHACTPHTISPAGPCQERI